ncbi:(2Fe-2S) ferredoxin domain-containing protein [Phytoactinopolyspora limicola]|uniref:(2Fe-2S) ferredoxin domain-containing protein n=1 Tax=Phytoactinopolyspora limicola TaxID=2715536 RepID=UPI001A9C9AAF|nr:(2Fe-2S) ferredoxin domain-containing protein [Phytoactinopolyspora limicola]
MSRQIVLVGRALGAPTAEQTLASLAGRLAERLGHPVRPALLDHGERSVHGALDQCLADGATDILLVPAQVPRDRYLETWSRKATAHWIQKAGMDTGVRVAAGVSETNEVVDALVAAVSGPTRPINESPDAFRSPSWSEITAHRRHVFVCRGPRCSAYGAAGIAKTLSAHLRERGQDDDAVLVTNTGCLVPCNLGPMVVVHPDDVWYTHLDDEAVRRVVDEHLCDGMVVDELRTPRPAPAGAPEPQAPPPQPPEDT